MHFKITQSADLKVIGKSIQVEHSIFPVDLDTDPRSTKNFWFEKADLDKLIFPEPIVHPKANLTDYIPCSIMGNRFMPIVSTKLKDLICSWSHSTLQFIPTQLHHRASIMDGYYYLNCYEFNYECVDIQQSIIKWNYGYAQKEKNKQISLTSFEQFFEIINGLKPPVGITIDPLFLTDKANSYDFFSLSWVKGGVGYYVSEKLKKSFEEAGVSGIEYYGINDLY